MILMNKKEDYEVYSAAKKIEEKLLESINPINGSVEMKKFFESIKNHEYNEPEFKYSQSPKMDKELITLSLSAKITQKNIEEKIIQSRAINALKDYELINSVATKKFCRKSKEQYGKTTQNEGKLALEIIEKKIPSEEKCIFPKQIAEILSVPLNGTGFTAKIEEEMSAKAAVNHSKKTLQINSNAIFSKNDSERLKVHEIETHIFRYLNGEMQNIKCMSINSGEEFIETEEGLAAYNEELAKVSSKEQQKIYAGRAYAVLVAMKHDFFETFEELCKYFDEKTAYIITQRVKRGIPTKEKGAFTKDKNYFTGLAKIKKFAEKKQLTDLYYGKITMKEASFVKKFSEIKEPAFIPAHLRK